MLKVGLVYGKTVRVLNPRLGQVSGNVHCAGVVGLGFTVIKLDQRLKVIGDVPASRHANHIALGVHVLTTVDLGPHPVPFLMLVGQPQCKRIAHRPVTHHFIALLPFIPYCHTQPPFVLIPGRVSDQANSTRCRIASK